MKIFRGVLLLSLTFVFSLSAWGQNLESDTFYTIEEKITSVPVEKSFSLTDVFVDQAQMLAATTVNLLKWAALRTDVPENTSPYQRLLHFGRWINDPNDDNCYNTRGRVLVRDSQVPVSVPPTNQCRVIAGRWKDPYTHTEITEAKGVQVDHMVPLKNAYVSGAFQWDRRTRCLFANYMGNAYHLLSVSSRQNMSKGDRSPAYYLPPTEDYRCEYIKTWLKIKLIWGLNMSELEGQGIARVLKEQGCSLKAFKMNLSELAQQRNLIQSQSDYVCRN